MLASGAIVVTSVPFCLKMLSTVMVASPEVPVPNRELVGHASNEMNESPKDRDSAKAQINIADVDVPSKPFGLIFASNRTVWTSSAAASDRGRQILKDHGGYHKRGNDDEYSRHSYPASPRGGLEREDCGRLFCVNGNRA